MHCWVIIIPINTAHTHPLALTLITRRFTLFTLRFNRVFIEGVRTRHNTLPAIQEQRGVGKTFCAHIRLPHTQAAGILTHHTHLINRRLTQITRRLAQVPIEVERPTAGAVINRPETGLTVAGAGDSDTCDVDVARGDSGETGEVEEDVGRVAGEAGGFGEAVVAVYGQGGAGEAVVGEGGVVEGGA